MYGYDTTTTAKISIREFIENENRQHHVVIWSKSYCPYCTRVKELFYNTIQPTPTDIVVYELDQMSNGTQIQNELYNITKQRTVPNVFVNNQHMGGNDDCQHKYRTGELKELL